MPRFRTRRGKGLDLTKTPRSDNLVPMDIKVKQIEMETSLAECPAGLFRSRASWVSRPSMTTKTAPRLTSSNRASILGRHEQERAACRTPRQPRHSIMIIRHFTDLDLYKLTVCEVIWTYFRNVKAKYRMTVRNGDAIRYWSHVRQYDFNEEISALKDLELSDKELKYLTSLNLFSEGFLKFLCNKPMKDVYIGTGYQDGNGACPVPKVEGPWCECMLFEIFCLSIGNELFADNYAAHNDIGWKAVLDAGEVRLTKKIDRLTKFKNELNGSHHPLDITEFGTRRRLSREWQEHVLARLVESKIVTGTSNVYLAMKMGIPVKGTFGHEFTMGMQGVTRVQDSQKEAFKLWLSLEGQAQDCP